jgi:hypothetical protein
MAQYNDVWVEKEEPAPQTLEDALRAESEDEALALADFDEEQ